MCRVVNVCQLCLAVPLTSDHRAGANVGCRLEARGPGGLPEQGPLSVITLIKAGALERLIGNRLRIRPSLTSGVLNQALFRVSTWVYLTHPRECVLEYQAAGVMWVIVLQSLHWLHARGLGPKHVLDLLVPYIQTPSGAGLLCVPRVRTKQSEVAFLSSDFCIH